MTIFWHPIRILVLLMITASYDVKAAWSEGSELLAFPGAMGFGSNATGGRFGEVRRVTNLNDSGSGSFRDAVNGDDPKIVVFTISGIIRVESNLVVGRNTTIAAQTSPGGITLYLFDRFTPDKDDDNGRLSLRGNTIIRHLRIRGSDYGDDSVNMSGPVENIMIDHMSVSWSGDEIFAATGGFRNSTIQWSTFEEPLSGWHNEDEHNFGVKLTGEDNGNISLYHSIITHSIRRNPSMNFGGPDIGDVRANLLYNCSSGFRVEHGDGDGNESIWGRYNLVSNYYQRGDQSDVRMRDDTPIWFRDLEKEIQIYLTLHRDESLITNNLEDHIFLEGPDRYTLVNQPFEVSHPFPSPMSPVTARNLALERAGAWPRDETTRRVIQEIKNRTGNMKKMNGSGGRYNYKKWQDDAGNDWPNVAAPIDSDNDGMPNEWELEVGLNPNKNDASGTKLSSVGYSNIEMYINQLGDSFFVRPEFNPSTIMMLFDN